MLPVIAHADLSGKERYDLMSPDEQSALHAVIAYRIIVDKAYYCIAAYPDLSDKIKKSVNEYQMIFQKEYDNKLLTLIKIIKNKPNVKSSIEDHFDRISLAEKSSLETLISDEFRPAFCQEIANKPQSLIEASSEYFK